MVARFRFALRGDWPCRGEPGVAEHELAQDFVGAKSVFSRGVDVAAHVEAVLGDVVAGEAAGDLLLGLERADAALAKVVSRPDPKVVSRPDPEVVSRPDRGVASEAEHVGLPVTAELEHLAAGLLLHGVPRPGDAGHAGEAEGDSAAELQFQGLADLAGK